MYSCGRCGQSLSGQMAKCPRCGAMLRGVQDGSDAQRSALDRKYRTEQKNQAERQAADARRNKDWREAYEKNKGLLKTLETSCALILKYFPDDSDVRAVAKKIVEMRTPPWEFELHGENSFMKPQPTQYAINAIGLKLKNHWVKCNEEIRYSSKQELPFEERLLIEGGLACFEEPGSAYEKTVELFSRLEIVVMFGMVGTVLYHFITQGASEFAYLIGAGIGVGAWLVIRLILAGLQKLEKNTQSFTDWISGI